MSQEPSGEDPPPSYDEAMMSEQSQSRGSMGSNIIDDQDLASVTPSAPPEHEVVVIPQENVGSGNNETQQNIRTLSWRLILPGLIIFLSFIGVIISVALSVMEFKTLALYFCIISVVLLIAFVFFSLIFNIRF